MLLGKGIDVHEVITDTILRYRVATKPIICTLLHSCQMYGNMVLQQLSVYSDAFSKEVGFS